MDKVSNIVYFCGLALANISYGIHQQNYKRKIIINFSIFNYKKVNLQFSPIVKNFFRVDRWLLRLRAVWCWTKNYEEIPKKHLFFF